MPESLALPVSSGTWPSAELILEQLCKSFIFVAGLHQRTAKEIAQIRETALIDLAALIRTPVADLESELAGFFAFRSFLDEIGIHAVEKNLGVPIKEGELSEGRHHILREAGRTGRLRIFSSGMRIGSRIIDRVTVMKSGEENDRD